MSAAPVTLYISDTIVDYTSVTLPISDTIVDYTSVTLPISDTTHQCHYINDITSVNNNTFVILLFYIGPEGDQHKRTRTGWTFK